jgi:hypothetical protein
MGWREHLPVHPAADLFPLMSESELRELGEDIKANGLQSPVVVHCEHARSGAFKLLDGRNRLDAMELVGVGFKIKRKRARGFPPEPRLELDEEIGINGRPATHVVVLDDADALDFVISANVHRRHLTGEQKRDLIAKVLVANANCTRREQSVSISTVWGNRRIS